MRRRKVSFSSDPRWTAMKRAGLAVMVALVLLVVMLWFGDSGQPPRPPPEFANAVSPQSDTIAPQPDTPVLPEPDAVAPAEPAVAPDPVAGETGHVPSAPGLDAGGVPNTTVPSEPIKVAASPKTAANESARPPKVANIPTKSASLQDGYFVQLGVFDDTENVSRVFNNVTELGLPAHIQSRVVVGPFRNKREAEAARNRLKDIAEGTVLPLQKTAKAPEKPKAKPKSRQRTR